VDEAGLRFAGTAQTKARFLEKADERQLRAYYESSSSAVLQGGPRAYTLLPTRLRIYPLPNAVYSLLWDYYAKDVPLTGNITNLWLTHNPDILLGLAGQRLSRRYRDAEAERTFTGLFNDGQRQLISDNIEREWANRDYVMGR